MKEPVSLLLTGSFALVPQIDSSTNFILSKQMAVVKKATK